MNRAFRLYKNAHAETQLPGTFLEAPMTIRLLIPALVLFTYAAVADEPWRFDVPMDIGTIDPLKSQSMTVRAEFQRKAALCWSCS